MKLLAVDGNSILNRAYYGIKLLSTKDGLFTNGIYGFLNILLRMQQETAPEAVAITFDMRAPTFRHKRYDGYKAQRKGMPDELAQQMPYLKELLGYLGYRIVQLEGYEADDLLGTLSRRCSDNGDECVIATGDRDSFQLINENVTVRLASTKGGRPQADIYDIAAIQEKYGIAPPQLIDVKALMGDSSDNIPGVAGVGEKTALSLIQTYGSLQYIYDNLATLDIRDNLRGKLEKDRDMAWLSRELGEINCQSPIDVQPADCVKQPVDNAKAYNLMARLELFSLMERFGVRPEKLRETDAPTEEASPSLEVIFNQLPQTLLQGDTAVDMLFSFQPDGAVGALCVIDGTTLYLCDTNLDTLVPQVLTAPCPKRTNHIKQLYHIGLNSGFEIPNVVFDCEIAAYILNPTSSDYSIGKLAGEYAVVPVSFDDMLGLHGDLIADCAAFPTLSDKLSDLIGKNGQTSLLHDIELPLARVLADMEHVGIAIDADGLTAFGDKLDIEISRLQLEIYDLAGEEFNINSPKQLGVILFEKLELPTGKKTKTKSGYSTSAEVLDELADKHPIVSRILEYRKVAKLKSTYVEGLLKVIAPDGRIHTSFQQTLTRTGRISSVEPNMQNIPVRTELGSELRRFFHAADGTILLDADYSQIELRVLAHVAQDANMIEAFQSGEDIHRNTAAQVFDMPPLMITPLMRSRAKAVNFGIVYGIGAYSLSRDIGVTVAEADQYIKSYLATYSGVRQYMEDTIRFATENGYVKTLFERRRYLPELASSNRPNREFGKRVAMNTPIQGTAADIIKIAMVRVYKRLRDEGLKSRLILQVHDELIVESPLAEADTAAAILREEMEAAVQFSVAMEADVGRGNTWLEAK
ncbi:DNA polymerase I [Ruminococcaceae bacterium OttesenSCG-928-L11]|nr:DNA polymerase I [Ruminococcaceae bacterium OttesenSCG-928-L11]